MNSLCAGLAILGLCVPLPGASRSQIEAADWPVVIDPQTEAIWGAYSSMASNEYGLLVSLWGNGKTLVGVLLEERVPAAPTPSSVSKLSRLDLALAEICRGTTPEKCTRSGFTFNRVPCNGGWMLLTPAESTIEAMASCKTLQRVLEPLHKAGKTQTASNPRDSAMALDAGRR